jgi:choline dehydrogenase-like flavoprotein
MTALTMDSMRQYKALDMLTECGGIEVARAEERMEELRRRVSAKARGVEPVALLTPEEVNALVPYILSTENDRGELSPGSSVETDEQILDWVAREAETALHPSCTCAMGPVVDPATMRVRGVEGLRVVGASVFPSVASGNIHAPTMMVAESAADLIRGATPLPLSTAGIYCHEGARVA